MGTIPFPFSFLNSKGLDIVNVFWIDDEYLNDQVRKLVLKYSGKIIIGTRPFPF